MDFNKILAGLFERISGFAQERPTAGRKYQLMGIIAETVDVTRLLKDDVLQRVRQELVLDIDADINFGEMADRVLQMELTNQEADWNGGYSLSECLSKTEMVDRIDEGVMETCSRVLADVDGLSLPQLTQVANQALGELSQVLSMIDHELSRPRRDEEYANLYDQEKHRYLKTKTAYNAKKTYDEWKMSFYQGQPTFEYMVDYRVEKVLHLFERGVFNMQVEHIQRTRRFPGELEFDHLADDHKLKKTIYKHYTAFRKMVGFEDGYLVVNPASVGRFFYAGRHEKDARSHRTSFLKYMHKVAMVEEEMRRWQAAQAKSAEAPAVEELNFYAPRKSLTVLLGEEWFGLLTTDEKLYNTSWKERFVTCLMESEWGEQIARDWMVKDKRLTLKCMVVGVLKDAGVLKGSYNQVAKLLEIDGENAATLAKYMGLGKKQPFADWISDYVKASQSVA